MVLSLCPAGRNLSSQSSRGLRCAARNTISLGLVLGLAPVAQALSVLEYSVYARASGTEVYEQPIPGVPLAHGASAAVTTGGSSASLVVETGPGMLPLVKLAARSDWPAGDPESGLESPGSTHDAAASVGIYDTLTILAPLGSTDFGANLSFSIRFSGDLTQFGGSASWQSAASMQSLAYRDTVNIVKPIIEGEVGGRISDEFGPLGQGLPATMSSAVRGFANDTTYFLYGTPIDLSWTAFVFVSGNDSRSTLAAGSAKADLGNTAIWLGIVARDAEGNTIEGLRIISESGFDWLNPPTVVPLPATVWMLLTALGAIAGVRAWKLRPA